MNLSAICAAADTFAGRLFITERTREKELLKILSEGKLYVKK